MSIMDIGNTSQLLFFHRKRTVYYLYMAYHVYKDYFSAPGQTVQETASREQLVLLLR